MSYASLEKLFHKDASSNRFAQNTQMAQLRLAAESTFRTGIVLPQGELFLATPRELSVLNEHVLQLERRVSQALNALPHIAQGALVRSLVIDEVVCTNELEGIHSTRRQISDLLEEVTPTSGPTESSGPKEALKTKRFRELARLYLELSDQSHVVPTSPKDIRTIYDRIMLGEDLRGNEPDGIMFRAEGVDVIGTGSRVIHTGFSPESKIIDGIQRMIGLANSDDIPKTYSAILSHFIFECIHPFYDGNGRTGRYLLALYLSRSLSLLTTLSLSRTIAENRSRYYRSFREAEAKLNHGELTMFVIDMLEYVQAAQESIIDDLGLKLAQISTVSERLDGLTSQGRSRRQELEMLYQLAQYRLFGAFPDVALAEIAAHIGRGTQMTRKYTRELEAQGLIAVTSERPLRFALTERACTMLGIGSE